MNVHFGLAIIDSNILAALGMQQILKDIVPTVDISIFISFAELQRADEGQFAHYFVASRIFFENAAFFRQHARRTIVLVNGELQIAGVPTLNVCQSEAMLAKTILNIHRMGHPQGHPMGHPGGLPTGHPEGHPMGHPLNVGASVPSAPVLSTRETEVAILLAKGFINKEIADQLNIGVTTVITHRKNIMEKLHARSLADIIIYTVLNGLVDVGEL